MYTIYSHEFLALPAVLVILFSCNTRVMAVITSGLDRQCAVVNKELAIPLVSVLTGESCFFYNVASERGALSEPPEVNGLNLPMLPGSFLPIMK